MAVPNIFATKTGSIPLSELDANFATPITVGTTSIALGDTAASISNVSLVNPTLGTPASGTLTNCTIPQLSSYATTSSLAASNGASLVGTTPSGTLAATTVAASLAELDTEKASTAALSSGLALKADTSTVNSQLALKTNITDLSASTGSTLVGTIQSGTGSVTRTVASKLNDVVSVKDFGAVGDGVADDTLAIQAAIISGSKCIYFPQGTYALNFITPTLFTVPQDTKLIGVGTGSILNITNTGSVSGSKNVFGFSGDNVTVEDLAINLIGVDSSVTFNVSRSNLAFNNLVLNGGHTAVVTNTCHCFAFNQSNTISNISISNCIISNYRYGILKSNTATGTQSNITLYKNIWTNNYANHAAFNSPLGLMTNIKVDSNTFLDCPGGDAFGTFAIMLGMSSAKNYHIVNNHFEGICKEAIHLEEAGENIVVSNNTFANLTKGANTNGGRGMYIIDSNLGGVGYLPITKLLISSNVLNGDAANITNSDYGIYIVQNAGSSTILPAISYLVTDNIVNGFVTGISIIPSGKESISDNLIQNCTTGLSVRDSAVTMHTGTIIGFNNIIDCTTAMVCNYTWPQIAENVIRNATTGISCTRTGTLGKHSFINVTTPISSTGEPPDLLGWYYEQENLTVAATPTNTVIDTLNFPSACNGSLNVVLGSSSNATLRVLREYALNIIAAGTVTSTLTVQKTAGTVATSGDPINNSGNLAITFTNSSTAISNAFIQASFSGTYSN